MKKEFRLKGSEKLLSIINKFSATEKAILVILVVVFIVSALILANKANKYFLVSIPARGGVLNEGTVGLPRSINPVLAFTDVDRDLSEIIYSGLMKYENGKLVSDLAQRYSISDDGLVYTFTLKNDIKFHDGVQLTADDIEFTIQKIQDGALKSPRRADWSDVTVKKNSQLEIQFILKKPYSPFLSNTTIGIIPKHIWKNVSADQFIFSQYNLEPIGSGPYRLDKITRDNGGIPEKYSLVAFNRYYGDIAYISNINLFFYSNEKVALEAYNSGIIDSIAGISAQEAMNIARDNSNALIMKAPLPRIFGIFFNQNSAPVLANEEVRQALNLAIDKDKIVNELLYGYGISIDSPIPVGTVNLGNTKIDGNGDRDKAISILAKAGWAPNNQGVMEKKDKKTVQTLELSIITADTAELKQAAELVRSAWESIGAKVNVKVFEYGDLTQNIIKTRRYDALLFGEFIGKDLDLYAFWHSSQRNSPGLNVAMYVNSKTDKLLETARSSSDDRVRDSAYIAFDKIIKDEVPAIFLYSPDYIYIVPEKLKGVELGQITLPSDRWYNINKWYINTDNVWKYFVK